MDSLSRFLGFQEQGKRLATFELTRDVILTCRIQQLFILQTVLLCLAQDESVMAHWLDTTGQFSADRAKSVLDALEINDKVSTILWPLSSPQPSFLQGRETALARLQVSLCFGTPQIFEVLDTLSGKPKVLLILVLALLSSTRSPWSRII